MLVRSLSGGALIAGAWLAACSSDARGSHDGSSGGGSMGGGGAAEAFGRGGAGGPSGGSSGGAPRDGGSNGGGSNAGGSNGGAGGALGNTGGASPLDGAAPSGTALADLAASMPKGSWAALDTSGIDASLVATGADGNHLGYTDDIVYDPGSQKFFYLGGDHNALSIFAELDSATNTWVRLTRAPFMPALTDYNNGMMHAYDHSAIDAAHGVFYHRMSNTFDVHRYDVATKAWDSPPLPTRPQGAGFGDYKNCCDALEYFPELGGLVWIAGDGIAGQNNAHVYLFKDSTREWSVLADDVDLAGTWHSAEYNPVEKVLVFYSAQTNKAYKLDASGHVTLLRTPPFAWYDGSSYASVFSVDLQSGKYLLLTATARELYSYDVGADVWATKASTSMPDLSNKPVVATPVRGLGVNFYTACKVDGGCQSWLYKPGP